jgi:S1-C subfamily serine protease
MANTMKDPAAFRTVFGRGLLQRLRSRGEKALLFAAGVGAAFVALLLYNGLYAGPPPLTTRDVNDTVAQVLASATPRQAFSVDVFQTIQPSLVLVQTESPGADDVTHGLGSGVVINTDGDILTSLHVVTQSTSIQLTFADGSQSPGQVVASQPENDIAVVRPSRLPAVLVPATLGNPGAMRVGDEVYAVGNPFGLYSSLSAGVISGFNRSFKVPDSDRRLNDLIQIDAAVNPGNSGGPLLNRYGEVIAIVTGIVNPVEQEFFVGVGFAVPIDVAGRAAGAPPY